MKSAIQSIAFVLFTGLALAGCNKHDDITPDTWDGEIRLNSEIASQVKTRATDVPDRQIAANKTVSFFVDDAGTGTVLYQNYGLTANGNGGFTKYNQQAEDMYYPATGNGVDIYAFLTNGFVSGPAFPTAAITHTVSSDQSEQHGANYLSSDLLYAAHKGVVRTPNDVQMNFYHLLSKVEVALKAGVGAPDLNGAVVTIENTKLKADFLPDKSKDINHATTGQATRAAMVTLTTADNPTASIKIGTAVSDDFSAYASAVMVPQTVGKDKRFIKVTLASGGELYYTIPNADGLKLESGNKYQFHITVNLTGLTVQSTISDWATGVPIEGKATLPMIGSKTDPATAAMGDFYFTDGTLEDKSATLTDAQKAACIGIVFWLGDITGDDPLLARDKPGCTHGLVVALHEATPPSATAAAAMYWSINTERVNDWTNHGDRGADKVNITEENKKQGYANTVALKAYNASSNVQNNAVLKVLPIAAIEQYQTDYPAPASSSGWYVPSIMELKYVCWGQGNGESLNGRNMLNDQFAKAGGTTFDGSWHYWSSSEFADYGDYAWGVNFNFGNVDYFYNDEFWVRALFAF